jgi:hypothetical protein
MILAHKTRTALLRRLLLAALPLAAACAALIPKAFVRAPEGIGERALKPGAAVADFALPATAGEGGEVRLSRLLEKGPAVLVFYRGQW